MIRILALVGLSLAQAGCGGARAAFDSQFPDNSRGDLGEVLGRVRSSAPAARPENSLGRHLVAASGRGGKLLVFDIANGRRLWARGPVDSRPVIGGRSIVFLSAGDVVCVAADSGEEMFRFPTEGRAYRGAAIDRDAVFVTLGEGQSVALQTGSAGRSVVLGFDADGSRRFRHEVDHMVAAPAAANGLVLLPWDRQNLSILDGESGDELARLRSTDDVISYAMSSDAGVYYGSRGVYRLTNRSVVGTRRDASYYQPPMAELPGNPSFGPDGYAPQGGGRDARERIRLFWVPVAGESVSFVNGQMYLLYYRYVFAFGAERGELNWVYRHPRDISALQVLADGLVLVDDSGGVLGIDAERGLPRWRRSLGSSVTAATLDAAGLTMPSTERREDTGTRARLLDVIFDQDNRLAAARAFAVSLLAKIEDDAITGDLIEIAGRRALAQPIRAVASQKLMERQLGGGRILEALARRYSFLDQTDAPPVGLLARAAAAMGVREAVPALLRHLHSHETEAAALSDLVSAVGQLGDRSAAAPLRDFVVRYHADDVLGEHRAALSLAAAGAIRLGGSDEAETLRRIAEDRFCLPDLATAIRTTLAEVAPVVSPVELPQGDSDQTAETPPQTPAPPDRSRFLSAAEVDATLAEHYDELRSCVVRNLNAPGPPARVRLVFVVFSDGHAERVTVSPPNPAAEQCLAEHVATIRFPEILEVRQQVTYWLPIRAPSLRPVEVQVQPPGQAPTPNP